MKIKHQGEPGRQTLVDREAFWAKIRTVPCPTCGAGENQPCRRARLGEYTNKSIRACHESRTATFPDIDFTGRRPVRDLP